MRHHLPLSLLVTLPVILALKTHKFKFLNIMRLCSKDSAGEEKTLYLIS